MPYFVADRDRLLDVIVAAAVTVAVRIIRMIPHAHANVRHAAFRERFEHVLLLTRKVKILHAALFLGDDG